MNKKHFIEWIVIKEKLHSDEYQPPHVREGEIWWVSLGENVGAEINGKSQLFSRPAIIFKKLSRDFYFVIPTTTQLRIGTWYVSFKQTGQLRTACLHQARSLDYRRFYSKLGQMDEADFARLKMNFQKLYI